MDLEALSDFNLVAAHGGFGRASRVARKPKATLSRHVSQLEQSLGVRLIERGTRTLRLTEEGQMLHERTERQLGELREAGEAIVSSAPVPRGRLRVSAPVVFAHVALGRLGASFVRTYPEVQLEIVADDRAVDPVEDGYDLVIRIDPAADVRLVGRQFLQDERLLVAAPSYPRPRWAESGKESGLPAVILRTTADDAVWRIRVQRSGRALLKPEAVLRVSSLLMAREAVLAGAGPALLPKLLVADDIASGKLIRWGTEDGPPVAIWVLHSSRRLVGAKVRAFMEMLLAAFPNKEYSKG